MVDDKENKIKEQKVTTGAYRFSSVNQKNKKLSYKKEKTLGQLENENKETEKIWWLKKLWNVYKADKVTKYMIWFKI